MNPEAEILSVSGITITAADDEYCLRRKLEFFEFSIPTRQNVSQMSVCGMTSCQDSESARRYWQRQWIYKEHRLLASNRWEFAC